MLVALYPRVSTAEQAERGYSIDEQIDRMKKYCDTYGWDIYDIYTDAGFSGASLNRPALQKLMKDAADKRIDKVLVYRLDRLSRSQKDTLYLIEDIFLKNNVDFVSMSENFDSSTPFGRAIIGVLSTFSQLERETIKERMMMGKLQKAKQGYYHGSHYTPKGYDIADGQLVVNEYEAIQIREIYDLFIQGHSPKKIANILTKKGYSHKHGNWTQYNVRNTLKTRMYIGDIRYQDTWYKGVHEPILDDETYRTAMLIKSDREKAFARNKGRATSYFGGLLHCKRCGSKYTKTNGRVTSKSGKVYYYPRYVCGSRSKKNPYLITDPDCKNKRWKINELDNLIFAEIRKFALEPEICTQKQPELNTKDTNAIIKSEIEKIKNQIEKLVDLYSIGDIPKSILQNKVIELNEKKEKLEKQIRQTKEETRIDKEEAIAIANNIDEIINNGDYQDVRAMLCELIRKIEIDGEEITIYWNVV